MRDRLTNLFVKKKRGRLLACTAVAVLILVGGLVACEGRPAMTDWEAVDALNESLSWDLDAQAVILSFTIPEGERDWSIRLDGEAGLGDADAIRTFNETDWVPGESYSFRLPIEVLLGGQLTLNVSLGDGAGGFSAGLASGALALISSQEVVEVLQNSFVYDGAEFSFTLPKGDWAWNIQISGRADTQELGGISLHFLDGTDWTPGETYSFELTAEQMQDITELHMWVFLDSHEWDLDLLAFLRQANSTYVNREYGFALTLPDGWADQVEIREDDPNMQNVTCAASFYMRDAGDWDGAGWLVGVYRCTSQEWAETEAAGNPYGRPLLADTGSYAFFAGCPTDVRYNENDPSEKERYDALDAGIPELLDSFSLINGGAYATAQTRLEEQEAVKTFQENSLYMNQEYGFSLAMPNGWAGQVDIRENDPNMQNVTHIVSFYMQNAGDWEGAGSLASISQCTPEEWAQNQENGNPAAWEFLADLGQKILYAEPSTDLPVDPAIPGALERYTQLSAQISKLLESFTLPA